MNSSGFLIVENVLSEPECDSLCTRLFEIDTYKKRAGIRNLMSEPLIAEVAADERLIAITEQIFGRPLLPYKATLFQKTAKANWLVAWHQDTAQPLESLPNSEGWGPASIRDGIIFVHAPTAVLSKILALRIHLDASTESNGPLRLIPGSHRERLLGDEKFREWTAKESVECHLGKGGVLAMSPLILHASLKSGRDEPRRVLHIEYAESLEFADGIRLAQA